MATISIVMSVRDGAATLPSTLDSILAQTERDFELIVIDDGSTDATPRILSDYAARDARMRVITQENTGLTRALIRGCEAATSALIARHDCGDRSHPERLRKQRELLEANANVVLASCSTRYLAPGDEELYVVRADGAEVRRSLLHDGVDDIRGLSHHGSAMFRRDAYVRAGGYRAQFRVAQDLDLWVRLAQLGEIAFVPEVLYEARIEVGAISGERRAEQVASTRIALRLRDGGDAQLLEEAARIAVQKTKSRRSGEALTLYFIASCLRRARNPRWRVYARQTLRRNPLLLRAWVLLLRR
jgi:glycosyltransferase involved in cell wall biosynthesis